MEGKIIDLSLKIYHGAPTFPDDPVCEVSTFNTVKSIGYNITRLSMSSHQGTHLDSPYHFLDDGTTVDALPLEKCVGKAFVLDFSNKKPKESIDVDDFIPYEEKITKGSKIIYKTGWDRVFPDRKYFSDFPYLSKESADWLAAKDISLLGMDTPTPNPTDWMYVHHSLLRKGIIIVEGLAYLDRIIKQEILFFAAPLAIQGRDGSPVRAVAIE